MDQKKLNDTKPSTEKPSAKSWNDQFLETIVDQWGRTVVRSKVNHVTVSINGKRVKHLSGIDATLADHPALTREEAEEYWDEIC